jgi:hypothetical protein
MGISAFAVPAYSRVDNRDHAIDTYIPAPNVVALSETRARAYWARNRARFGPETPYLALDATFVFPSEIQDLWPKLINSETTASFFSHGREQGSYQGLEPYCILIFDTRTERLVSSKGYVVIDLPNRGTVARFGPYVARFIGTGK